MTQESSAAETMRQEAARALSAAGEQIALALKESQPQVEALGEALQQLAAALARKDQLNAAQMVALNAAMMQAVNRLQFYDRMTQHLSHVQDYLARSARQIGGPEPDGGWTGVHQTLSERLLSDTQRFHLGKNFREGLLAASGTPARDTRRASSAGDIDLF
jgi:hypothetical protein